jgi:hypothetical protein
MKISLIAAVAALMFTAHASADTNVAYLAQVSSYGPGMGDSAGALYGGGMAPLDSVTDGTFTPLGQQWNYGSVYWSGSDSGVTITLAHIASVSRLVLEADNNDKYRIEFLDRANVWRSLTTVETDKNEPGQNLYGGVLSTAVEARAFRISAYGDNHYSVSEFQAGGDWIADNVPGAPVPEPSTWLMLGAGLAVLGARKKLARRPS